MNFIGSRLTLFWVLAAPSLLAAAQGEAVYKAKCSACHDSGAGYAPRISVRADWAERETRGRAAMMESALKGIPATAMAAKGGYAELSDAEVRATVDYMLAQVGFREPVATAPVAVVTPSAARTEPVAIDDSALVHSVAQALQKALAPAARIEVYAGEATVRGLNIRVAARAGAVILSGAVEKSDVIARAQGIARTVAGVRSVESRLVTAGMLDFD